MEDVFERFAPYVLTLLVGLMGALFLKYIVAPASTDTKKDDMVDVEKKDEDLAAQWETQKVEIEEMISKRWC